MDVENPTSEDNSLSEKSFFTSPRVETSANIHWSQTLVAKYVATESRSFYRNDRGHSLLADACQKGDISPVIKLLDQGLDPNCKNQYDDRRPLHHTTDPKIIKILIEHGADLTIIGGGEQCTPLHYAKNIESAKLLLNAGVNINVRDIFGRTALHNAYFHERLDMVQFLIAAGADISIKDDSGKTFNAN
jgi:ankyrin repeat protein